MTEEELVWPDVDTNSLTITTSVDKLLVPYLGWYWRDPYQLKFEKPFLPISLVNGHVCIDVAGKWDYPSGELTKEEAEILHQLILNKLPIEIVKYLDSFKERCKY